MATSVILVVDDEPVIVKTLVLVLNRMPDEFLAIGATSASEALTVVHGIRPDLVLLDAMMPGTNALEHAVEMRGRCGCKVLLMSGHTGTSGLLDNLLLAGEDSFEIVAKPVHPMTLIGKIREMLQVDVRALEWKNPLNFRVQ